MVAVVALVMLVMLVMLMGWGGVERGRRVIKVRHGGWVED